MQARCLVSALFAMLSALACSNDGGLVGGVVDFPHRSYEVTAQIVTTGQPHFPGWPAPAREHRFRLWLDFEHGRAVAGVNGSVSAATLTQSGGQWVVGQLKSLQTYEDFDPCGKRDDTMRYQSLVLNVSGETLVGSGTGFAVVSQGDVGDAWPIRIALNGTIDREPPRLFLTANGFRDPLTPYFRVMASEPLPAETRITYDLDGQPRDLTITQSAAAAGPSATFLQGGFPDLLTWERDYPFTVLPALADLDGNQAPAGSTLTYSTPHAPAPQAEDGFEGPLTATLAGTARVLEGDPALVIGGLRSVLLPPTSRTYGITARLTARLAVPPGKTRLRATLRILAGLQSRPAPRPEASTGVRVGMGVPGGIWLPVTFANNAGPWDEARKHSIGPAIEVSAMLPANAPEVFFDVVQINNCQFGLDGAVIDDVRVE